MTSAVGTSANIRFRLITSATAADPVADYGRRGAIRRWS